jgi:hypothetical protein
MVAGTVHLCGAWGGDMSGPTRYNKRGMFENSRIRNEIVKPHLRRIGCDPLGQNPLPDIKQYRYIPAIAVADWRKQISKIILNQGYDDKSPWFYKGAKMCLSWPLWNGAFPQAKWIIVRRDDGDIINSCLKTGFMRAFKDAKGWQGWIDEHKKRFQEMHEAGMRIREVWPAKMVAGNFEEMKSVIEDYGLEWNEQAVLEFISPAFWSTKG